MKKIEREICIACKRGDIWIPPSGRPIWTNKPNARELTDEEMKHYNIIEIKN